MDILSLIDDEVKTGLQDLFMEFFAYSFFALTFFCRLKFDFRDKHSCTVTPAAVKTMLTTAITENMQYACNSLRPTVDALSQTESHKGSYAASIVQKRPLWYIRYCCHTHFTHFAFFRTRAATDSCDGRLGRQKERGVMF